MILFFGVLGTLAQDDARDVSYDEADFADLHGVELEVAGPDRVRYVYVDGFLDEVLVETGLAEEGGDANVEIELDRPVYAGRPRRGRDVHGAHADMAGGGRRSGEEPEADEPRGGCEGGHVDNPPPRPKPRPTAPDVRP